MGIEFKDYYKTLGISQSATPEEIRKAFRQLARQHHPDVAQNRPDAEGRFKEINEAYEVLGNPDRRKRYDTLGDHWRPGADIRSPFGSRLNGRHRSSPQRGNDFEFQFGGTGFSDFFDQIFGTRANRARPRSEVGSESKGSHRVHRADDVESDIVVSLHEALRGSTRPITIQRSQPCGRCRGSGKLQNTGCSNCEGQGQITRLEKYQVRIPPGVREGQRLRIAARSDSGIGAGRGADFYLRVRFEKHPLFHAEKEHLIHEVDVAPWEAVLGGQITVSTLDGPVTIRIPGGSQNGRRFRLRGHGLPTEGGERGDLLAVLRIQIPAVLDDRERRLWEKLADESSFRARVVR